LADFIKKWGIILFIVLSTLLISAGAVSGATYTVCGSGCDFTSIQAAVDAASNGDTINVGAGTYNENMVVLKSLNI